MRIGIDIDNTLTDIKDKLTNAVVEYAKTLNKYVENTNLKINDIYNNGNIYQKLFGFTYNQLKRNFKPFYLEFNKLALFDYPGELIKIIEMKL